VNRLDALPIILRLAALARHERRDDDAAALEVAAVALCAGSAVLEEDPSDYYRARRDEVRAVVDDTISACVAQLRERDLCGWFPSGLGAPALIN